MAMNATATAPMVLLADPAGRLLPVYIGLWEAISISSAQSKEVAPRPLTHNLFLDLTEKYAIEIDRLEIDSVEDGVYYAHLALRSDGQTESLDCRPSDGIAIALRAGAPVFVDDELLSEAGPEGSTTPSLVELSAFLQKTG